jgi:hypothetical protein
LAPEAELVLAVIEKELHGRTPIPALLDELAPYYRDVIPGHVAEMHSQPKPSGGRRKRKVWWLLTITGPRVDGRWRFHNGWLIRRFELWRVRPSGLV